MQAPARSQLPAASEQEAAKQAAMYAQQEQQKLQYHQQAAAGDPYALVRAMYRAGAAVTPGRLAVQLQRWWC